MILPAPDGCMLTLRVHPGARRNAVTGTHDGALKISLTAAPSDGKANEALVAFLAEALSVPRARIRLTHGQTSRRKTVHIAGLTLTQVAERLIPSA